MRGAVSNVRTKINRNRIAIIGIKNVMQGLLTPGNISSGLSLSLSNLPNEISLAHFIFFLPGVSPFEFFLQRLWLTSRIQHPYQHFLALVRGLRLSTQTLLASVLEKQRREVFRKHLHHGQTSAGEAPVPSSPAQQRQPAGPTHPSPLGS